VPINQSVYFAPYGDYFTSDFSFIWLRDLPLIKAMGANVLRVYGWLPENDHSDFLDAVAAHGLYLMATFYMGDASESPVQTQEQRDAVVANFAHQVGQYATHPALLIWSFGNELNGVWNGFLQQLGKSEGKPTCGWDDRYDDLGGCWVHKGTAPTPASPCYASSYCVYSRLFELIDEASRAAKDVADVLVVSAFADVDALYDKVGRAGHFAKNLDAWTAQVYRGNTFGDFFAAMGNNTDKPVLLTEYGVDAYHDACGTGLEDPCYNTLGDDSASWEDGETQAEYALKLTGEIINASSDYASCSDATRVWGNCSAIGGFLMSWVDEFWKGAKSQASCDPTFSSPSFSPKGCTEKAHVTCGNWDAADHDLCGYQLDAAPDHYVNEEWFGITSPSLCGGQINSLRPRVTYWKMRELWSGAKEDPDLFGDCDELVTEKCVELGNGGHAGFLDTLSSSLLGSRSSAQDSHGAYECSGRGHCTVSWEECGAGSTNFSATPCCSCDFGFAGDGCEQLDARLYATLGAGCTLALLMLLMLVAWILRILRSRGQVGVGAAARRMYAEPLLGS